MSEILEEIVRRMNRLEAELNRMQAEKQPYEILNARLQDLTADETNLPSGNYDLLYLRATSNWTIHGIDGGREGRLLRIRCREGSFVVPHLSPSAPVGSQISTPTAGTININLSGFMMLVYETQVFDFGRWVMFFPLS